MSITFPTLDLGDLGASLDDAIRNDPTIAAEESAVPDAARVVEGESAATPEAVAAAKPEAVAEPVTEPADDTAYQARFEADYAAKSKADIAALQAKLNPQIAGWRNQAQAVGEDKREADEYIGFLESKLGEYDPDEVAKYRRNRGALVEKRGTDRKVQALELQRRTEFRDREFRRMYPDLDPDDPELVEAFHRGDAKLEAALIRERLALRKAVATPQATPRATEAAPATLPTPSTERDAQGRFTARVDATRQKEQARGSESVALLGGASTKPKPGTSLEDGRRHMAAGFIKLGIPMAS